MTPEEDRKEAVSELADAFSHMCSDPCLDTPRAHRLSPKVAHLSPRSIRDAAGILRSSLAIIEEHVIIKYLLYPANASYRIELIKQIQQIKGQFFTKWLLSEIDQRVSGKGLTDYDVTPEHVIWTLIDIYYLSHYEGAYGKCDFGSANQCVDAIRALVSEHPEDEDIIKALIRERKVYEVDDIMSLLSGATALRKGNL